MQLERRSRSGRSHSGTSGRARSHASHRGRPEPGGRRASANATGDLEAATAATAAALVALANDGDFMSPVRRRPTPVDSSPPGSSSSASAASPVRCVSQPAARAALLPLEIQVSAPVSRRSRLTQASAHGGARAFERSAGDVGHAARPWIRQCERVGAHGRPSTAFVSSAPCAGCRSCLRGRGLLSGVVAPSHNHTTASHVQPTPRRHHTGLSAAVQRCRGAKLPGRRAEDRSRHCQRHAARKPLEARHAVGAHGGTLGAWNSGHADVH